MTQIKWFPIAPSIKMELVVLAAVLSTLAPTQMPKETQFLAHIAANRLGMYFQRKSVCVCMHMHTQIHLILLEVHANTLLSLNCQTCVHTHTCMCTHMFKLIVQNKFGATVNQPCPMS